MAATKKSSTRKQAPKKVNKKPATAGKPATKKTVKPPAKKVAQRAVKKAVKKAAVKKAATPAKRAPAGKSAVKKPSAAKPPVAKRVPAKKSAAARKPVAGKKAVKKPAAKSVKTAAPSTVAPAKPSAGKKPVVESVRPPVRPAPFGRVPVRPSKPARKGKPVKKLSAKELARYRKTLLDLRDQVVDGISFLTGDNLNRSQREASGDLSGYSFHMADQGTDNYDREFALNLVSTEQDVLYEIDEAIRRIDGGTYGLCELSGEPIERARLNVLPYARCSVAAQSELERGRTRYRPFGPTLSHGG